MNDLQNVEVASPPTSIAKVLWRWSANLSRAREGATTADGLAPQSSARLRRCHLPADVLLVPEYYPLRRAVAEAGDERPERWLPHVAVLVAHARAVGERQNLGRLLRDSGLSEARFRRLVASATRDELFAQMRVALRRLEAPLPVLSLVDLFRFWGPDQRRELAEHYYA